VTPNSGNTVLLYLTILVEGGIAILTEGVRLDLQVMRMESAILFIETSNAVAENIMVV